MILFKIYNFLPIVISLAALTAAAFIFFYPQKWEKFFKKKIEQWKIIIFLLVFRLLYAFSQSYFQYKIWKADQFAKTLLPPFQPIKFFISYALIHFWLNFLISLFMAAIFYVFFNILKRKNDRFFENSELELGFASFLAAGWPNLIAFIPMLFLIILIFSFFRTFCLKEEFTAFSLPFVLAAAISIVFGLPLLKILGL